MTPPLPPLPKFIPPANQWEYGLIIYTADQMLAYGRASIEDYKSSLTPVAWGVPNSRITERQPFLSLLHQLPVEGGIDGRRKQPLYPEMLVPLYRLDEDKP